ncbi:MAG: PSD1 and planctomycete cytochrome C domain-containing protein [Phycisphaerales bacterium]|nr:PSD1 and planctomycete cytochrome C domain-containing protein [Phycisphaerales bacterium]
MLQMLLIASIAGVPSPTDDVRFGRDIRPILSDQCFLCHGPDRENAPSDLRLDSFEAATAQRRGRAGIVPGNPEASLLWQRVNAHDPSELMPPPKSGKAPLTNEQKDLVRRWIEQGAAYEDHWAFERLEPPSPPVDVDDPWVQNDIDRFVLADLLSRGLRPNLTADKATLCRRVFLDVTGLPPTREELDAFIQDDAPDAWERLVDRLLNEEPYVTRHAERMAVPWLDLARYADTAGIHMDAGRTIWPWRDWVLEAFRTNKPWDEFVVEQLAGDLLPDRTQDQIIASGFNRCHVTTDEGGAINDEALFTYAVERTNTLGTVFLGLTLNCAQCHDHKYDPITQQDYYALLAFFNNNNEPGLYSQQPNPLRALEPAITITTPQQQEQLDALEAHLTELKAQRDKPDPDEDRNVASFKESLHASGWNWTTPPVVTALSAHGSTLELQDDQSVLATSAAPANDDYTIVLSTDRTDLRALALDVLNHASLPGGGPGRAQNGNAILSGIELEVVSRADPSQRRDVDLIWGWADIEQTSDDFRLVNALTPDNGRMWAIAGHEVEGDRAAMFLTDEPFGYEGGSDLIVTLHFHSRYSAHSFGRVRLHVGSPAEEALARLPLGRTNWYIVGPFAETDAQVAYDTAHGPEEGPLDFGRTFGDQKWRYAPGVIEGQPVTLAATQGAEYVAREFFSPDQRDVKISLGSDDGIMVFLNGELVHENRVNRGVAPDQDAITVTLQPGRNTFVAKIVNTGGPAGLYYSQTLPQQELAAAMLGWLLPEAARTQSRDAAALDAWRQRFSPAWLALTESIDEATQQRETINDSLVQTMVMQERAQDRPTYVMMRGAYDRADKERPVTRGIPAVLGSIASDETLTRVDLARWLVSDENPLTARVMVNRLWAELFGHGLVETVEDFGLQGTWPTHPELLDWIAADFRDNGWNVRQTLRTMLTSNTYKQASDAQSDLPSTMYARFPRQRLGAEQIRDQALHVSGLLVEQLGGPSVKPYQPDGLWREVAMPQSNTRTFVRGMGDDLWRRSLYTYWKRAAPPPSMLTLDAPTREYCAARRLTTNTPLQALLLWNDEQFVEAARATAARVLTETPQDERLVDLYRRCTGDEPSIGLQRAMADTLERFKTRYTGDPEAAAALCSVGDSSMPDGLAPHTLAAWTMLANAVLSSDAAIVKD